MLQLGDVSLDSHILVGTGKYTNFEEMRACHIASGTGMVTVALRRVDLDAAPGADLLDFVDRDKIHLLPNTAGCYTPTDAVITARLGRELLGTPLVKLEVIGDPRTLFPDMEGTLEAARILVQEGFTVLPYCLDDPVACQRLADLGCAAVMPLAAPIGSGLGIRNPHNIRLILEQAGVPVLVDAGVGTASDAAIAMELGCAAVLMNTAIAGANDPVAMARAMRLGIEAGRLAYLAGRIDRKPYATASSPMTAMIE